jgi:Domain of unknown function (DUF1707)
VAKDDSKRARTAPTQHDRARVVTAIRRTAEDGMLSSREVDERIEQTYRATTLAGLDGVLAGLPNSPHARAEAVLAHGIAAPGNRRARKDRPFWFGSAALAVLGSLFWVVVWFFTGGPFIWVVGAILCSVAAFTYRLAVRHRRTVLGAQPFQRRRWL